MYYATTLRLKKSPQPVAEITRSFLFLLPVSALRVVSLDVMLVMCGVSLYQAYLLHPFTIFLGFVQLAERFIGIGQPCEDFLAVGILIF